jgi:DNA polymerase I
MLSDFADRIFLVDFEFHPTHRHDGNIPDPVCMMVRNFVTGDTQRYWRDALYKMTEAPFPTGEDALIVAYFASAELDCFLALGWPLPKNVLDLFVEFRCLTNGKYLMHGRGLVGALLYFGLPSIESMEKDRMRSLILEGGPWSRAEQGQILAYCESDVVALSGLLKVMAKNIDWPRALLRGRYIRSVSQMQHTGTPIDQATHQQLTRQWCDLQHLLIDEVNRLFNVYEDHAFRVSKFEAYLSAHDILWPRLPTGALDLQEQTFREMARCHPEISPLHELRYSLSQLRLSNLTVGSDGRNRCLISPFSSKTGRNQPSNSRFIFGPSVWLRGLIKPEKGYGLAYIDYSQQEFGIAAALSGDLAMQEAYMSGDPYLSFAKQAGAVPHEATKHSHGAEREQFKACVLAVQYGMGEVSLAQRINQPVARARQLLAMHRQTYPVFWKWSDSAVDQAALGGKLWSVFGWHIHVEDEFNNRSLRNFPMQANGAEVLRLACIYITEANIRICAPVHDALLIEAPLAKLDTHIQRAQALMTQASRDVLEGFELRSDVKIIEYPYRYMDERGITMWDTVMQISANLGVAARGTSGS